MKKTTIIILAATLLMSSCGIYKKYERPEVRVETSKLYRDTTSAEGYIASDDTTTLGSTPWREVFTDSHLQSLIDSALQRNVDLRTAALSVAQSKAMLNVAKLAFVPSFVFDPSATISSWNHEKAVQRYSLPVEASWSIDLFGSLLNAKRGAQANLLKAQDFQRSVQSNIICSVANMYYTLLMLDRQLEITLHTEQLASKTYEMMLKQKQFSGTDESAVMSAKANYLSVQASIPDLRRQIREVENAMSLLLREAPGVIKRSSLEEQNLPSKFSIGIPIQLLANRPDVHAAEMALANCFYNVNKARSAFYPNITVNGSAAWTNNGGAGIVNPGKLLASAVGSLTQPLFHNGRLIAALKVAKMDQEVAYMNWEQSILKAGSEVSNALALYQSSDTRIKLGTQRVEALQRNVDVAEKMFKMGQNGNYLNVITAQQSLLSAQIGLVAENFQKMQAVVNLYSALGGGTK